MRRRLPWLFLALALLVALAGLFRQVLRREPAPPPHASVPPAAAAAPAPEPATFATRRITGRVLADGAPFAGARVRLESDIGDAVAAEVTTGADGAFALDARPATAYVVTASAEGRVPAIARVAPADDKPLELILAGCDRLSGVVRDSSGGVIAGALLALAGRRSLAATSRDDGSYELCLNRRRDGWLIVSADGYGSVGVSALDNAAQDIVLVPEGVLRGRVVRAADGAAIAGARVVAQPRGGWSATGNHPSFGVAETDELGRFRVAALAPGGYAVQVTAPGFWQPRAAIAVVLAGRESGEVVAALDAGTRVRGTVLRDGVPAAGLSVVLRVQDAPERSARAVTGVGGALELDAVPPGEHTIAVEKHDVVSPPSLRVAGAELAGVVVMVRSRGTIRGRVVRDGDPVAGAAVHGFGGRGEFDSWGEVVSAADGSFELAGAAQGQYSLWAIDEATGQRSRDVGLELAAGESREGVVLDLAWRASVSGAVVDPDGRPVLDAYVIIGHGRGAASGPVDARGRFDLGGLPGGTELHLDVSAGREGPRYEPATPFPRVVLPGAASRIEDLRLVVRPHLERIAGVVLDASGAPASDVRVSAQPLVAGPPIFDHGFGAALSTVTGVDGQFVLAHVGPGDHALLALAPDGAEARLHPVAPGADRVVLRLERMGRIAGKLVGFERPPHVAVTTEHGRWLDADVDGDRFTAQPLYPGRYRVSARTERVEIVVETDVAAGGVAEVTLKSPGHARVRGRVLELGTLAPVAGLMCDAVPKLARRIRKAEYTTDAAGRFDLVDVPSGELRVWCSASERTHVVGSASLAVADGGVGEVELVAVPRPEEPRGWMGVQLRGGDFSDVRVFSVVPDGPAARAGVLPGDEVVAVDGLDVERTELGAEGVVFLVGRHPPGFPLELTVRRAGATKTVRVIAAARPAD